MLEFGLGNDGAAQILSISHHGWQAVDAKQWVARWRLSGAASSRRGRDYLLALGIPISHYAWRAWLRRSL